MLRQIVMVIFGVTGITPDKIITYIVIVGSLVIVEVGYFIVKRIIIDRLIGKGKR